MKINHAPSLNTDSELDYEVKKKLIKDTLILLNLEKEEKKK